MTGTCHSSRFGPETGATAVEFAVVVGLLVIILFGILEFGFIFLQKHLVANAAREGLRIGVRANNYDTFTALPADNTTENCQAPTDRSYHVDCEVRNYLQVLYDRNEPKVTVERAPEPPDPDVAPLVERLDVTVKVPNFFPELLSGLVPGVAAPNEFSYTASGDYEDPEEALEE
jgi:hypothetical protein